MRTLPLAAFLFVLVACGSEAPPASQGNDTPYTSDPGKTVVIGAGGQSVQTVPPGGCVTLPSGECVTPDKKCKADERTDVVVDSSGKVVAVVCYPASASPTPVDENGNVELGKENKGVVAIDGLDDGDDIAGNVTSSGNNVTVYGQGADVSVIGGNVTAEGNNFSLRGVRVKGNVNISGGNNATLVLCVVEGDVNITGNNTVMASCNVLGKITINGVNTVLVSNQVGGGISVSEAKNTVCDGNVEWNDANSNKLVDPGESGAPLTCGGKGK
ncbi:MAG: hypothetical protein KF819_20600 [Labilithrix sp.]|nr:hypothetical protein [Labilithrix sp.]